MTGMDTVIDLTYTADLSKPLRPTVLRDLFVTGNQLAHRFTVALRDADLTPSLSGAAVEARFVRSDGATVIFPGTAEGNRVTATLPAACYAVPGRFTLDLRVSLDGSITSVFFAEGALTSSATGEAVQDPAAKIPTYNELIDTVNGVSGELARLSRAISAYNLLDNSDFRNPVNQRGASSVTTNWGYIIDRWLTPAASVATPISVSADGVTLHNAKGTSTLSLRQNIENLPNGTYTAVAFINGHVGLRVFTLTDGKIAYGAFVNHPGSQVYIDYGGSTLRFHLQAFAGYDITCEWAALYKGEYTAEVIPAYVPKGYTAELLACQRYLHPYSSEAARPASGIDCAPPMTAAAPTQGSFTVDGTTYYYNSTEP